MKHAIRAVLIAAGAAALTGCASTSHGPHSAATDAASEGRIATGREHYQFAPLPPAETVAQDLEPLAPRSTDEILADAEAEFRAAQEAQQLGDETRTYEHFAAMMDRLHEAKLDPITFKNLTNQYLGGLQDADTLQRIYSGTQPSTPEGPTLDGQVDGTASINERVQAEIEAIQRVYPKSFQAGLDRSFKYLPYVRARFAQAGLPDDLVWLAMVESQFTPKIDSRAGAGGMWQFMRGTGRRYGLSTDWYLDERYDWRKATDAAVQYLGDLYDNFDGNWPLAVTAYNMGEGGLGRAIAKAGGEDDLWELLETKGASTRIKLESKRFYAKLLATVIVAQNPEKYGFEARPQPGEETQPLKVKGFYALSEIEKQSGIEGGMLAKLNPQFVQGYTPPSREAVLAVPGENSERVIVALASMPEVRPGTHKVQRGETLSQIASIYKVSVSALQSANRISSPKNLRVGQQLVIPGGVNVDRGDDTVVMASASRAKTYTVRRGDSLSGIAAKHHIAVRDLQRWNNLGARTQITTGQTLQVSAAPTVRTASVSTPTSSEPVRTPTGDVTYYTVQKGDFPDKIAKSQGVALDDLMQWNGMTKRSTIRVGQKLKLYTAAKPQEIAPAPVTNTTVAKAAPVVSSAPSTTETSCVVSRGETASSIAKKYGVSTGDLLSWNGLTSKSVLHVGDTLVLHKPETTVASVPTSTTVHVAKSGTVRHIHAVTAGENAEAIADQYAVPVETLYKWNGWTASPALAEGDEVVVFKPAMPQD